MIQLQNINKRYNDITVLKDINLDVKKGELLVIKGVSGSGKSTLLHIIASFMQPSSGAVFVKGENIASLSDYHAAEYRAHTLGYITQNFYLFDALNVTENLLSATLTERHSFAEAEKRITEALKWANIAHKAQQNVATLSGGEKQRVIIARAIINNPDIILCDEPTANLDSKNVENFLEILKTLKAEKKCIIIATHDPIIESAECVDRVLELKEGNFV